MEPPTLGVPDALVLSAGAEGAVPLPQQAAKDRHRQPASKRESSFLFIIIFLLFILINLFIITG